MWCCRDAVFDVVSDEVLHPSEKMPLQHLAVNELAEHLFQLGKYAYVLHMLNALPVSKCMMSCSLAVSVLRACVCSITVSLC